MSISTIEVIGERIKVATPSSKIAVFIVKDQGLTKLDCVFATGTACAERIRYESDTYVGSFDASEKKEALKKIKKALLNSKFKGYWGAKTR